MKRVDVWRLGEVAEMEFADIVEEAIVPDVNELRLVMRDGSIIDVWFSLRLRERYGYHWERRAIDGTLYRHDNAPHKRWEALATFPRHFHDGSEYNVSCSTISQIPEQALREFLCFARTKMGR